MMAADMLFLCVFGGSTTNCLLHFGGGPAQHVAICRFKRSSEAQQVIHQRTVLQF